MQSENRTCQNCKTQFTIEPEDFTFYEKIQVPAPTWCPECRLQRRMTWRNERTLYKRECDFCKKITIGMYPPETAFPVYCQDCWWSDKWDATNLGTELDFRKPLHLQFSELLASCPRPSLHQIIGSKDSPYANIIAESKNIYLSYSIVRSEDILYSKNTDQSHGVYDSLGVTNSERCYENIFGDRNYNSHWIQFSNNCIDSWFLFDCINCKNCALSVNLRNKEHVIRNIEYSKEEYFNQLGKLGMESWSGLQKLRDEFTDMKVKALHKYANIVKSTDSTGDNLMNVKDVKNGFDVYEVEHGRYLHRFLKSKDSMDVAYSSSDELMYEYINTCHHGYSVKFSANGIDALTNAEYTDYCPSSSHLFACIGLKSKQYCILNKQYAKEEYESLVPRIIKHMNDMPYVDKKGRVYRYGEFFPPELSPFAYNETIAQEYFPLTKEEAEKQGYRWKDPDIKEYQITILPKDLPDNIEDVPDSILKKTIGCVHEGKCTHQCTTAFRIIPEEFSLYKRMNLPLPRLCPNCRHYERLAQRNPLKLWHRQCMCDKSNHFHKGHCPNEFETSYAPERNEMVYCEQCYQAEVV